MARQGLISGVSIRREAGRYLGRRYVLPREALLLWHRKLPQVLENRPDEENPKRRGTEGGRFTRSTEDARPMKPGNSVEGKTLLTGKEESGPKGHITENRRWATVTHLDPERPPSDKSGCSGSVVGVWESVDERRR